MIAGLPGWVIAMLCAIEQSEDEHPKYYGDFHDGIKELNGCPEARFLAFVPHEVRRDIAAVMYANELAEREAE